MIICANSYFWSNKAFSQVDVIAYQIDLFADGAAA